MIWKSIWYEIKASFYYLLHPIQHLRKVKRAMHGDFSYKEYDERFVSTDTKSHDGA